MDAPDLDLGFSPDQLMALAVLGLAGVLAVFALLALVRLWSARMQKGGGGCGGLDAEELRRQRDAGEISQEEYDAILRGMAGANSDKDKPPRRTIKYAGDPGPRPERSESDGQD